MPNNLILLGIIASAHGIKGGVTIRTYTAKPEDIASYGPLIDKSGNTYIISNARLKTPTSANVLINGVTDRNKAESLRGVELYLSKDRLPEPGEDEFYYSDLIGLKVVGSEGQEIGVVFAVQDFGAGDVLEIKAVDGKQLSIPFTKEAVPVVSIQQGKIIINEHLLVTPEGEGDE
jgi:16S rRNA processing protein RimM